MHKFGRKPLVEKPLTIQWKPKDVIYPPEKQSPRKWKIFCQKKVIIQPKETKMLVLGFAIEMSEGMVLASLKHQLKLLRCCIQNETIFESVPDVIIGILNISDKEVVINPGQELCFLHYSC